MLKMLWRAQKPRYTCLEGNSWIASNLIILILKLGIAVVGRRMMIDHIQIATRKMM